MTAWIIIGSLYAVAMLSFRLLGGFGSAAEALRQWGSAASGIADPARASSS
jgi:hypothetical protein